MRTPEVWWIGDIRPYTGEELEEFVGKSFIQPYEEDFYKEWEITGLKHYYDETHILVSNQYWNRIAIPNEICRYAVWKETKLPCGVPIPDTMLFYLIEQIKGE